jgi:hypothetical protein
MRCGDIANGTPTSGHLYLEFAKITAIKVGSLVNTGV